MLSASSFAFHVTYTCPLECAHCCFGSSPAVKDKLDRELVLDCIKSIPDDIRLVAFTGGEPFLHGKNLQLYVAAASARGFATRIVTSAYFGKSVAVALSRLKPLVEAGLKELSISWDDYHEQFVPFSCIRNVAQAAVDLGLSTAINSVQSSSTRWTKQKVMDELGGPLSAKLIAIAESQLNSTGRAQTSLSDANYKDNGYLGPCPYVLTGPTLSAKGKLLACCGVIPDTERLAIAGTAKPAEIPAAIARSFSNPLFLWLFLRGPYALIEEISRASNLPPPNRDAIGGNCEACKILLTERQFESKIDEILRERITQIASELVLLESMGWLGPREIANIWFDRSQTRIGL